jgi:methylenetetrahydrofolate reductase (NADPH)
VDAGAEYIVTQMFFDNAKYFDFVNRCRAAGIMVPIVPGLKPLTNKKQLSAIPRIFNVELPQDLVNAMNNSTTDEGCEKVGEEWLTYQSKELKKAGVPVLHYYTLGKPQIVYNTVSQVF